MAHSRRWQPRYSVLAVIFVACVISFMDRMAMSVAIPYIAAEYHLTPVAMGVVMSMFFASYAISQIPGGLLADRFGVRRVGTVALLWWSAFTAVTGAAGNLSHMLFARLFFGFGEGVFPTSAFKAVALWFPKRERGTANAIMLAAGQIGATLAPLLLVPILAHWGWRAVFYSLSLPGIATAFLFWKVIKDTPAAIDGEDPAQVAHDTPATVPKVSFIEVLKQQNMLRFVLAYFFFDIAYWGLTSWLPTYLVQARGFSMVQMGVAAALPQLAGFVGSILGGWLSDPDCSCAASFSSSPLSNLYHHLCLAGRDLSDRCRVLSECLFHGLLGGSDDHCTRQANGRYDRHHQYGGTDGSIPVSDAGGLFGRLFRWKLRPDLHGVHRVPPDFVCGCDLDDPVATSSFRACGSDHLTG